MSVTYRNGRFEFTDQQADDLARELARRCEAYERGEMGASDYRESIERVRQSLSNQNDDTPAA
jgi:hypothetical protein